MRTPKYNHLPVSFFKTTRSNVEAFLPSKSLVIIHANATMPTNGDGVFPFCQNSNLFYLTGIEQEETILTLLKGEDGLHPLLFISEKRAQQEVWEGEKYTPEEASEISGIAQVFPLSVFDEVINQLVSHADYIYLQDDIHPRKSTPVYCSNNYQRSLYYKQLFPLHTFKRIDPLLARLRTKKHPEEIKQIKKAIDITHQALRSMAYQLTPGIMEYTLEGIIVGDCIKQGASGMAYEPIVASGKHSCTLHYVNNSDHCKEGELVLLDVGACYGHYGADITRVFPINGRFSPRQRDVYQGVHHVLKEAMKQLLHGQTLASYEKIMGKIMREVLIDLSLLPAKFSTKKETEAVHKLYCMHNMSHHLGLETHDTADYTMPITPGMVLTVEPGIYIPEEKIGIRLEENVLITEQGVEVLSQGIPIDINDIEALCPGT